MAETVDVARLDLQVDGAEKVDRAWGAMAKFVTTTQETSQAAAVATGKIFDFADSYEVLERKVAPVRQDIAAVDAALDQLGASATQAAAKVETAATQTAAKTKNFGLGVQTLAQTAQDFMAAGGDVSRGLFNIQNNLPGLITGFGGSAGLAGAVGLAGLALGVALPHIQQWVSGLGLFQAEAKGSGDILKDLKQKVEELEKKPLLLAVDTLELEAAKGQVEEIQAALKAVEALRKGRGHYEKESGKAIEELFAESPEGAETIHDDLRKQFVGAAMAESPEFKLAGERNAAAVQAAKDAEGSDLYPMFLKNVEEVAKATARDLTNAQTAIGKKGGGADVMMGKVLDQAEHGSGREQAEAQKRLREALNAAGKANLAESVGLLSPDELFNQDVQEEAFDSSIDAQKRGHAAQQKKDAKAKAARAKAQQEALADPDLKAADERAARQGGGYFKGGQFVGIGTEAYNPDDAETFRLAQKAKADAAKQHLPRMPTAAQAARTHDAMQQEGLARQIHQATGGQLGPDQSRAAAKRSLDLQSKGIDAQTATQGAVMEMFQQIYMLHNRLSGVEQRNKQLLAANKQMTAHQRRAMGSAQ